MPTFPITSGVGILAVLCGVCAFFFWIERATRWTIFQYLPPLVFIYLTPVLLANGGVIPVKAPIYDDLSKPLLSMMLTLMLLNVDVAGAFKVLGRGVVVMLLGTVGVILGAAAGASVVKAYLGPTAWKAFGSLTGSWVGGTGNMFAVADMIEATDERSLAVLADTSILLVWLPLLLASKRFTGWFDRFAKVDADRVARMDRAAEAHREEKVAPSYRDFIYLLFVSLSVAAAADWMSGRLPLIPNFATASTWRILLVTTIGIALSFTPLRRIPSSRELGMALIFLFMAQTGATADLSMLADQAGPFLLGALICIFVHGAFCVIGAKLLHVDIHTTAIASAANIGGVATATVVAEHHKPSLTGAAILMALLGYAFGNYAGYFAGVLCRYVMS